MSYNKKGWGCNRRRVKTVISLPICFCWGVLGADCGGGAGTLKLFSGCPCCLFPKVPLPSLVMAEDTKGGCNEHCEFNILWVVDGGGPLTLEKKNLIKILEQILLEKYKGFKKYLYPIELGKMLAVGVALPMLSYPLCRE